MQSQKLNWNISYNRYLQILLLLSIEIYLILKYTSTSSANEMNPTIIGECIGCVVSGIIITFIFQKNPSPLRRQIITISFIFLFSFFVVHFVNYIGWLIVPEDYEFLNVRIVNKACILSSASFIGCLIGNASCYKSFKESPSKCTLFNIGSVPSWIMIAFMALFILFTDSQYFSAGGNSAVLNEIGWNPIGAASYNACVAVVIANVITVIINNQGAKHGTITLKKYFKFYQGSFYILTLIFLILILISGDRGPMMDIFISYFLGFIILRRYKFNMVTILSIGVVSIIILKYLSFLRGNPEALSFEKIGIINERMVSFHEDSVPVLGEMRELSDVVNAYHLVFEFVETNFMIYGVGVVIQLIAIFPGIRYLIMSLTGIPAAFYSTDQLATLLLGEDYGAGTTCVADAFYNFGFLGSIIFFTWVGYFLRKLDLSIYKDGTKLFVLTMAICYFTKAIYLGRSYFFQPVTLIVYTYLILLITIYINRKKHLNGESIAINR